MKSKATPFLILLVMAMAILFITKLWGLKEETDVQTSTRKRGFDRSVSALEYTKHALCRMECRHISKTDVEDIMRTGEINYAKTDLKDKPCPTYALQGYTNDGQQLRVIFAQCNTATKVVTCYDLDKDFDCYCPGDEKKTGKKRPSNSTIGE